MGTDKPRGPHLPAVCVPDRFRLPQHPEDLGLQFLPLLSSPLPHGHWQPPLHLPWVTWDFWDICECALVCVLCVCVCVRVTLRSPQKAPFLSHLIPPFLPILPPQASYSGTTASIRVGGPGGILQCISLQRSGNQLTTVLLGGAGFSVEDQCNPNAATSLVPNGFSVPYCNPSGPNNAPFQSTGE